MELRYSGRTFADSNQQGSVVKHAHTHSSTTRLQPIPYGYISKGYFFQNCSLKKLRKKVLYPAVSPPSRPCSLTPPQKISPYPAVSAPSAAVIIHQQFLSLIVCAIKTCARMAAAVWAQGSSNAHTRTRQKRDISTHPLRLLLWVHLEPLVFFEMYVVCRLNSKETRMAAAFFGQKGE